MALNKPVADQIAFMLSQLVELGLISEDVASRFEKLCGEHQVVGLRQALKALNKAALLGVLAALNEFIMLSPLDTIHSAILECVGSGIQRGQGCGSCWPPPQLPRPPLHCSRGTVEQQVPAVCAPSCCVCAVSRDRSAKPPTLKLDLPFSPPTHTSTCRVIEEDDAAKAAAKAAKEAPPLAAAATAAGGGEASTPKKPKKRMISRRARADIRTQVRMCRNHKIKTFSKYKSLTAEQLGKFRTPDGGGIIQVGVVRHLGFGFVPQAGVKLRYCGAAVRSPSCGHATVENALRTLLRVRRTCLPARVA